MKVNKSLEKRHKAAVKVLKYLANNPRHPGLQTHAFESLSCPNGEKVFEAYAEQNTPAADRIFWFYGPQKGEITVFAITPHP
ncbi:MAG: hypothetical protein V1662_04105 [Candidatus Omnitrophota bacterium]